MTKIDQKDNLLRERDAIDIDGMRRLLKQVSEDIPRMTAHYLQSATPADPHIFNYLFTAKFLIEQAIQQLSRAHMWILPDDDDDDTEQEDQP